MTRETVFSVFLANFRAELSFLWLPKQIEHRHRKHLGLPWSKQFNNSERGKERNPWKIHFLHAPTRHLKFIAADWKVFSQFEGVSAQQHATDFSWKGDFHLSVHYSSIFLPSETKADRQFDGNENKHRILLRAWRSSYLWCGRFSAFVRRKGDDLFVNWIVCFS